ncbi:MAG: 6-phosphofructokinase [Nanoarchaeota archaeon]|nr:6-phosphofructokinase [Nanoarchaeota archaeon]
MKKINSKPFNHLTDEELIRFIQEYSGLKVGVLTGGGDAPGCNAVFQGILDKAEETGYLVVAFKDGFYGVVQELPKLSDALWDAPIDLSMRGGTIIGSSRVNPSKVFLDSEGRVIEKRDYAAKQENREAYVSSAIQSLGLEGLILAGGDNTLSAGCKLSALNIPVVGIPKSIDDDYGFVYAFGRHTSVDRAVGMVDYLRSTAESHGRDIVVEVMGRKCGRIALDTGIATHADIILTPEFEFLSSAVFNILGNNRKQGKRYNVIVISEGAVSVGGEEEYSSKDSDGYGEKILGGSGAAFAKKLSQFYRANGFGDDIVRSQQVGHFHRSGNPNEADRVRGYKYGVGAMELVLNKEWGSMIGYMNGLYISQPIETINHLKRVSDDEYDAQRCNTKLSVLHINGS